MPTHTPYHIDLNTNLLIQASWNNEFDEVKRLIPISNPKADESRALRTAVLLGYIDIVELLIPVSDPKTNNEALIKAAELGNTKLLTLLIPVSDPTKDNSKALRMAAKNGHIKCVEVLNLHSNPRAYDQALMGAVLNNHINVIKYIIPLLSNYKDALPNAVKRNLDTNVLQQCIDEYEALQQKERLSQDLDTIYQHNKNITKRKM